MKKKPKNTGRTLRKKRAKNTGRTLIILLLIIVIALASVFISTIKKPLKISQSEVVNVEEGDSFSVGDLESVEGFEEIGTDDSDLPF